MSDEHAHQSGFLIWFRGRFPGSLILAVPNGGKRDMATAKRLKEEGVVPGVPDLFVPEWKLWIEMKKPGGRLSPAQKEIIPRLEDAGYTVIVGYGAEDASKKVLEFYFENFQP